MAVNEEMYFVSMMNAFYFDFACSTLHCSLYFGLI